jgi:serine/threonine-protein kinase
MAPERFEGPGRGTPESDVYSLAAVAFELLAGSPPRPATGTGVAGEAPDLRREWPQGTPAVLAVLERGLDPDPRRRQGTAGSFVEELEDALERAGEPEAATAPLALTRDRRPAPASPRRDGPSRRAAVAVLAAALALVVAAIALSSGDGDDSGGGPAGAKQAAAGKGEKAAPEPAPAPAEEEPAEGSGGDSALGAQLNDEGFALIQEGRYEEAVPVLEQAVASFPEGSDDLNYAYALFNLGNALRLAGRPEEAIPILEQRLEIPNQTGTVRRELELARQEAED